MYNTQQYMYVCMYVCNRVAFEFAWSCSDQLPLYMPVTLLRLNAGNWAPFKVNPGRVLFTLSLPGTGTE